MKSKEEVVSVRRLLIPFTECAKRPVEVCTRDEIHGCRGVPFPTK